MFVPACPCPVVLSLVAPDLAEDQVCPLFGQRQKLWACCPGTFPASGTCMHVCVCACPRTQTGFNPSCAP